MKKLRIAFIIAVFFIGFISCEKGEEIDKEKPSIDLTIQGAFPVNCDTLYFGETFMLKVKFTDNVELGSYSIDIHNNFDHHSHSTEVTECSLGPIKDPVNPFTFIQDYAIPEGLQEYETNIQISLPAGNSEGNFDDGDYHFFIRLTDKEGWSEQKGLSVKLFRR
ncbi:MAG: DUF4625 domain-containing protein [Mariniphaga sp.]|jgi:hypothetical protein|nr:DUF4625 domain-containing protein [Mariniphaga sp.]